MILEDLKKQKVLAKSKMFTKALDLPRFTWEDIQFNSNTGMYFLEIPEIEDSSPRGIRTVFKNKWKEKKLKWKKEKEDKENKGKNP